MSEQLSFLPPPPFNPQWPTRGTLADRALKMLMDGRMIDHPDFENDTQSWRLGAVVFTLRTLGCPLAHGIGHRPVDRIPRLAGRAGLQHRRRYDND